ncbi:MAG: hypothetical protein CVV41_00900 [Candidatus Riflebacteria bacterium HGW-Riflebacteria-1]|jgi:hypothetical protein|nr:MAG: hypothetical protein CVV41_00900 [Candidatus Riflebacteria bacterium HGW-Riflebacteria-1]
MLNRFAQLFTVLIAVFLIIMTVGCGGGGGGNPSAPGTDYSQTSVLAPNTLNTLNTPASVYSYNSSSANVSIKLPVESGTAVNYALVVVNTSANSQPINLRPESYVLSGSLLAQAKEEALRASQRSTIPQSSALDEARMRQLPFEEKMRRDFVASLRNAGAAAGLRQNRSLRASDHSGEKLGDIVKLNIIVSYMFTQAYQERSCKLVRMTDHCKIFVDQNPYPVGGLSAVEGQYAITEDDLNHMVTEFENYIYPLMNGQYGKVYDIDGDGRLSIVFSPVYPSVGFAGLFNTLHMNPTKDGYKDYSNQRDMIGIWTPHALANSTSTGEKWRMDSRETIAHEMQHAINFSAKIFPNDIFRFPDDSNFNANEDSYLEAMWLDESLSVGSEARYRLARGQDSVYEARFDSWAKSSPHGYGLTSWAGVLGHYGQKGLFNYYLFEQYGAEKIKAMNQSTSTGISNIEAVYGKTIAELAKGFSLAVINESLRKEGLTSVSTVDKSYKFTKPVNLDLAEQVVTLGSTPISLSVPAMGTAYYLLKQPASFGGGEEFQFRIESYENLPVDILLMRLPNP